MERLTHHRKSDGVVCPNCTQKDIETRWGEVAQEMADKLCAYEDAEEQGLLIRLPCKVGDTYYCITRQCGSARVEETKLRYQYIETAIRGLGKWAFPTREEAEAALKGDGEDV